MAHTNPANSYQAHHIKVLKGLEAVRKRPGMYIGSVDEKGLHHLIWELLDNAIDEVMAGFCDQINITLHPDHSITVHDNGRGIPIGMNQTTKLSVVDTVFTTLHAGGKFDDLAYKTAGGLHGVGSSVVNALSSKLVVDVFRDKQIYHSEYEKGGKITIASHPVGNTTKRGTKITFWPDPKIFTTTVFNPEIISVKLQATAFLFPKLKIVFANLITAENTVFYSEQGIVDYVAYLNQNQVLVSDIFFCEANQDNIKISIALQYNESDNTTVETYANAIRTADGGSHLNGFRFALIEVINDCARKWKMLKDKEKNLEHNDLKEGLTAVVCVQVPEALIAFESQTKTKLLTPAVYTTVKELFKLHFTTWFLQNKKTTSKIIQKALVARDARLAAKATRETIKQLKKPKQPKLLLGKLTACQTKLASEAELFLVEGDSAGGSARLGRNKKFQAILPLKGKIINVEKASLKDLLQNEEIQTIIAALGCGIGENCNLKNLKYGKVIIMTDADVDGSHIRILLLTFFYRYMQPLITNQKIYVALPPLYKITNTQTKKFAYAFDEVELQSYQQKFAKHTIQRYKGLGEMNAQQLWETTMDPTQRQLILVNIQDLANTNQSVVTLMGEDSNLRKDWINSNVNFELE